MATEAWPGCCEHVWNDHDQHGCTVDVSTVSRTYERCHGVRAEGRTTSSNEEDVSYWPRGVMDPLCPSEHVIAESMDRRVLWHLENQLAVSATTDYLKDVQRNLAKYLHQTCAHHWHDDVGYEDQPPLRQCLWCNAVEDMA